MSFVRKETEYYNVAVSDDLSKYLEMYRSLDPIFSTMDDRKLILFVVHKAIEKNENIYTEELDLSRNRNVKLKKTSLIAKHFESINKKYRDYGVQISARQYFHRLVMNYLIESKKRKTV